MKNGFKVRSRACFERRVAVKALAVAAFATLSIGTACAADLSAKPIDTPTLDYLQKSDSSTPVSAYTLTTPALGATENIITKYTYDATNGLIQNDFQVNLKNTVYGTGSPTTYYQWKNNAGKYSLVESAAKPTSDNFITFNGVSSAVAGNPSGGDFVGQVITGNGIAINDSTIDSFNGNFIANTVSKYGGGLYITKSTITNLTADFIGNSTSSWAGGIFNSGTISNLSGTFVGNSAGNAGAIYNSGEITNLKGDFIANTASASNSTGGAIDNRGKIGNLTGDFIGNSSIGFGGAIYCGGSIGSISGDYINNTSKNGGAIYNYNGGNINSINGEFINNSANQGGAIFNRKATIENIDANFIGNYAGEAGGAILNYENSTIKNITGNFIGNSTASSGGAIFNWKNVVIESIKADFVGNYSAGDGGAIYNNKENSKIGIIEGSFIGNYAKHNGGALFNGSGAQISEITADFIGNYSGISGGAIYNIGSIGKTDADAGNIMRLTNVNFLDNYAKSESGTASGGAIYSTTDVELVADGAQVTIAGNWTESAGVKDDNAIYISGANNLTFNLKNNGSILFKDNVNGATGYTVDIKGDDINNTTFYLQNDIKNADVSIGSTTINAINNQAYTYNFNSLTLNSDVNFVADVDLAKGEMDRFTASNYGTHSGKLNLVGLNLLSEMEDGATKKEIQFAEVGLKDNVEFSVGDEATIYTPLYKYNAGYENRQDAGYVVFARAGASSGNPSSAFNPTVLGSSTSATVGALGTMNQTMNYSFQSSSDFMNIPYAERLAIKNANKYALAESNGMLNSGVFSPLYSKQDSSSVWVKPYASFESVDLKNGPKVSNITYGTLIGFDTELQTLKNGWDRVFTGYLGYNGASQRYSGVDSYQNGGLLGGTMTMYKGNFFNATTLSVGASVAQNQNMYGSEDFAMLMSGIGNKTGYNFEFKEGKYIIQPSMLLAYTFVNTFDYTNSAGVRIDNKPLHALQLAPGVKFIGNFKNGWQPYASVSMVWNVMGESDATANGVRLPQMSIKPYVQYGLGLQKRFKDRCMAYGQAMILNGGRTGLSLTAGFRWALGKEGKGVNDKVENSSQDSRKVIKFSQKDIAQNKI